VKRRESCYTLRRLEILAASLKFCKSKRTLERGVFMDNNWVLLMLSGGRDSFLAACRLLDAPDGYKVKMATYDNGCSYQSGNAGKVAERIIGKYGADRAEYLGVHKIGGIIREFFFPYFNMKPSEQAQKYMGMTPSQFHCLVCRTSMYICSVWLAQREGAHYIAEGGREDQQFVIELPGMAQERYRQLVSKAGLELLLPVYDLNNDWERDNELLRHGYLCKTYEPKCMIGVPVNGSIDQSVIDGVHAYYDEVIFPQIEKLHFLDVDAYRKWLITGYDELER
jgi:hypothetical protein